MAEFASAADAPDATPTADSSDTQPGIHVPLAELLAGDDVPWPLISAASLSSLILHVSALIVLASLTFPPARQKSPVGELTDHISLTTHIDVENVGDLFAVELEDQDDSGPSLNEAGDDTDDDRAKGQEQPESPEPPASPPPVSPEEPEPVELPAPSEPAVQLTAVEAAPTAANVDAPQSAAPQAAAPLQTPEDVELDRWLAENVRVDTPGDKGIVERFILYDIGRLKGEAGERARREFNRLGPQHVPALIHGLNKAASVRASCPVLVISYKLNTALRNVEDAETLRYAAENIGRDVPENAPHWSRIRQMQRLAAELQGKFQPQRTAPASP